MTKHIQTRESVRAAESCYNDEKIDRLVPPEGNTPRQVAELPISLDDRLWGLIYSCGASKELLVSFACKRARRFNKCEDLTAVETAEAWLRGEATRSDCDLAEDHAWNAGDFYASDVAAAAAAENIYEVCDNVHGWTTGIEGRKEEAAWQINTLVSMLEADE